jgi:hypothetical protein
LTDTVICPDDAPDGTVVTIDVLVTLVTLASVPLNFTVSLDFVGSKPVPLMVMVVPTEPLTGVILEINGITLKSADDVAVSPLTVTLIFPVVAPDGTVVTISVLEELVTTAAFPLKATALFAAVVSKFDPTTVTVVATVPPDGEKLLMPTLDDESPHPDSISTIRMATGIARWRKPYSIYIFIYLSGGRIFRQREGVSRRHSAASFENFATPGAGGKHPGAPTSIGGGKHPGPPSFIDGRESSARIRCSGVSRAWI